MGRAGNLDGREAFILGDTMIDMHHIVTGRELRGFGDEILTAFGGFARPDQPVPEHILLADDDEIRRLEPLFERQYGEIGNIAAACILEMINLACRFNPVIGQHRFVSCS